MSHDPGDEDKTPTDPDCRVPPGGDPHVGDGEPSGPLSPLLARAAGERFGELANMLHEAAFRLKTERDELLTGRTRWTGEARRNWQGRLRRLGFELDQALGRPLP